ncbi:uncharacterized protein [Paramormyrops kingsleyae]|uniref:uncharacterized protein n=1 Tax=Paramormyrops kingsleyae TaxID=1676925 RepID=UPI003B971E9A
MKTVVAPTVKKVVRHDPIKMQNCVDFHSQLTSIMDILTKAAVAEIIKVVEDNCCVLRLEINRSQNENERLKRKIQWMESELRGSYCANVYDGLLGTKNDTVSSHDTEILPPVDHPQRETDCDMEPVASEAPEGQAVSPTTDAGKLPVQQSPFLSSQETLECVVKPEQEEEQSPKGSRNDEGNRTDEGCSLLWTSLTQDYSDTGSEYPDCSQIAPVTVGCSHGVSFQTASPPASTQVEDACETQSLLNNTWDFMPNTVPIKQEAEIHSVASDKVRSDKPHSQQEQYGQKLLPSGKNEHLTIKLKQQVHKPKGKQLKVDRSPGRTNLCGEDKDRCTQNNDNSARKIKTQTTSSGKKWFICAHCGKSFAYFSCYKIHLRSHTGEKPYSCVECGKSFTQQSNLTKHESVHSGKKPFSCTQCGKSFRHRYNLTLHQRVHSGEKPFQCMQCGKSFAQSCHFKRHQLCHEGQKSYKLVT